MSAPTVNAINTDSKIPVMMARAFSELMYSESSRMEPPMLLIFTTETATAEPSNSKTMETVVEVGIPNVLNMSSIITSVIITARKMTMISEKTNMSG